MRARAIRRMVAGCTLASGLAFAPAASAAKVTVTNFPPFALMSIAMDSGVSTLTVSRDASGARRIHEDGAVLTLVDSSNVGGCSFDGADVVCTADTFLNWKITNTGGSITPPLRDVVIAKSATHGDATGSFDLPLDVTSSSLIEAWLPDGANMPTFLGSNVVAGTPEQPADIVHAGSAGLSSPNGMGAGADLVIGSTGPVTVTGGTGADTLIGSTADDTLDGGGDNDLVRGGLGHDTLTGGAGLGDVVSYDDAARALPLAFRFTPGAAATIGTAEDGGGDAVGTGFEALEGTPLGDALSAAAGGAGLRGAGGDDALTGSAGPDSLAGGAGDDVLDGGPGLDSYAAGDGADDVRAADGLAEIVDCGLGIDVTFAADADDTVSGCEGPQAAGAGDGGLAASPVVETLATASGTGPAQGLAAPAAAPPVIGATLTTAFRVRGSSTIVTALTAKNLPANSNVTISCAAPKAKKSRCPIKSTSRGFAKATASSPLAGLFKKRRLPADTVIAVRISAPGVRGRRITLTTRKGIQPKRTAGCVAPGSTTPASCAAA